MRDRLTLCIAVMSTTWRPRVLPPCLSSDVCLSLLDLQAQAGRTEDLDFYGNRKEDETVEI
uniref:Uncharacterized protein n=1 Tax=Nelumbo nucifera TaxID=4432 RepID=A0A822XWG3_NELNU|nr:TPA_asm: hypothetical protein HUJ06_024912 [Nelumbo nucifera]